MFVEDCVGMLSAGTIKVIYSVIERLIDSSTPFGVVLQNKLECEDEKREGE